MPSGVMSTRDRMLARAGLEGVALEAADWPEGVVGVPGDGRAGLGAEKIDMFESEMGLNVLYT